MVVPGAGAGAGPGPGAGAGAWCCLVLTGTVALPSVLWVLQTLYRNSKCQLISQPLSISQTKLIN